MACQPICPCRSAAIRFMAGHFRFSPPAQGFGRGPGAHEAQQVMKALVLQRSLRQGPVPFQHRHRLGARLKGGEHRSVDRPIQRKGNAFSVRQADLHLLAFHFQLPAAGAVTGRPLWVHGQDDQVGAVQHHVGQSPGHLGVVADADQRGTENGCSSCIDPGAIGPEEAEILRGAATDGLPPHLGQPEQAGEVVQQHGLAAGDLGKPALGQAAQALHLPEPVLGVHVAQAGQQVGGISGL